MYNMEHMSSDVSVSFKLQINLTSYIVSKHFLWNNRVKGRSFSYVEDPAISISVIVKSGFDYSVVPNATVHYFLELGNRGTFISDE